MVLCRRGRCVTRSAAASLAPETARSRPVLLTVDDDPSVSRAVARDLRRRYGYEYRIVRADSGAEALEAIREVVLRGEHVAAILADYRMPRMNGDRLPRAGHGPRPPRSPGAADRVRGHQRRDRGDQRRRCRPLPAEALGATGGEALSGRRRAAGGLAAGGPRPSTRSRSWAIRGRRPPTRSATSWPATGSLPLVQRRGPGRPAAAGCGRVRSPARSRW